MLTMRKLGRFGRFANQLFQYAFLRIQARTGYQCPEWIGQKIFGFDDSCVTVSLPQVKETGIYDANKSSLIGRDNIDIVGYFQYHTSWWGQYKRRIRELFTPLVEHTDPTVTKLQQQGYTVIGIHIRRGDYGTFKRKSARYCFRAPCSWYRTWLDEYMPARAVLFVCTDEPNTVLPEFSAYDCVTSWDSGVYSDFYGLTQVNTLLISNSSFGFMASMLNEKVKQCWRPRLSKQLLMQYNPWNAHTVLRDEFY